MGLKRDIMEDVVNKYSVFIVSDATGKTAYSVVKAVLVQFKEIVEHFLITHYMLFQHFFFS